MRGCLGSVTFFICLWWLEEGEAEVNTVCVFSWRQGCIGKVARSLQEIWIWHNFKVGTQTLLLSFFYGTQNLNRGRHFGNRVNIRVLRRCILLCSFYLVIGPFISMYINSKPSLFYFIFSLTVGEPYGTVSHTCKDSYNLLPQTDTID